MLSPWIVAVRQNPTKSVADEDETIILTIRVIRMAMMMMMTMMTTMIMISDHKRRKMFQVATCGVWRSTTDGCSEEAR